MMMQPFQTQAGQGHLGVVALLAVLVLVTWGGRAWHLAQVREATRAQQQEAAQDALAIIRQDFAALQEAMMEQARRLAGTPAVVRGMRTYASDVQQDPPEALVEYFAGLALPKHWAVELYDPTPRLVAWKGTGMPLDRAPNAPRFLQDVQTAIAREDDRRVMLSVWWPVRDGPKVVGAVRMLRLLQYQAPVQNQYLSDYAYTTTWQRAITLSVQTQFEEGVEALTGEAPSTLLYGVDGTVLGRVMVQEPSEEHLLQTVRARYDDVLVFWLTLLLGWGMGAIWSWYRRSDETFATASVHRRLQHAARRFVVAAAAWWGLRYVLLLLDVPGRWQPDKTPLAPLFDPAHLASTIAGGLMRSTGDLLVTALFAAVFALAFLDLAARFQAKGYELYRMRGRLQERHAERPSAVFFLMVATLFGLLVLGLVLGLGVVAQHAVLDSTLDYFARRGLVPEPLVLVAFGALLLFTLAVVTLAVGLVWIAVWFLVRYRPVGWGASASAAGVGLAILGPAVFVYLAAGLYAVAPWPAVLALTGVTLVLALAGFLQPEPRLQLLVLRNVLLSIFVLTVLLYPMLYQGIDTQRRVRMRYAVDVFDNGRDPRVVYAIEQVLRQARQEPFIRDLPPSPERHQAILDSAATELLRGSLLASLNLYEVSLTVFDSTGTPVARSLQNTPSLGRSRLDEIDAMEFDVLRQMYAESGYASAFVDQLTGRRESERFQYAGIAPVRSEERRPQTAWVMVRAEPQTLLRDSGTPFPKVLLPSGLYGSLYTNLSLAEFRDGVMVRSFGRSFGRYRLDETARRALLTQEELWKVERVKDQQYLTYYRRHDPSVPSRVLPQFVASASMAAVAARVPAINTFDHLYYLLRLTVAGLFIGLPVYLMGLYLRYRRGLLPAPQVRFRDKVLNAFLAVGIVTVAAVGFVGLQLVTSENERATRNWLQQNLERVEEMLVLEGHVDELPYRVLDRVRIDTLAAQVGLDLNLYRGKYLVASSRPQLVREDLIDERLPVEAYQALYYDGYRFTYTHEQVGSFTYTTGFRTLLDEQGQPRYVVAIPTLPEQERIEEERARTVAYLFGALLLLVLVVLLTASLIANALARPIARLREGLEDVARGHFERPIPVSARDEIGELVETFNAMQQQLAESRRKLAQQERQLAWREMARQVAHEIKNPLTPMKLSVQHMRRAYHRTFGSDGADNGEQQRFASLFDRITSTLIEQINALARIANEFHSFARMPTRAPEPLDLNAVVREAVSLMQEEEGGVAIEAELHDRPLVIEADREELRRLYINLIKNAIQAIPDDRAGHIVVATRQEQQNGTAWAYSRVSDNGTGIPRELRGKIFQPNFSTKTSGTGLGLAIAAKSVEDLSGEIGFETEEDVGTTFWVRLPVKD